jgi:pimeloyl-ACP methyl ester carboxylesterase
MITKVAHLASRSVRYLESGTGRPMILLHAFPLSADMWLPDLHRVPRGWRFIAPDLRGFRGAGPAFESPGPEAITIDDYAADVLDLMDHLELERAALAGLSMGGYVAFALMRRAMPRIDRLVLASTRATADTDDGRAARDKMIELARREGAVAIAREMVPKLLGATTRRDRADLADAVGELVKQNSADGLVAALHALKTRPDSTPLLSSISCPAAIIWGDEDVVIPRADVDAMHARISGSRLVVLPRAGHLVNLEANITAQLVE